MDIFYKPPVMPNPPDDATNRVNVTPSKNRDVMPSVHVVPHAGSKKDSSRGGGGGGLGGAGGASGAGGVTTSGAVSSSQSSGQQSDNDDDTALEDLQRNIETLERTLKKNKKDTVIDMEPDSSRSHKLKSAGKRFLR